jgi:hypothetical protein
MRPLPRLSFLLIALGAGPAATVEYQQVATLQDLEACLERPGQQMCHQTADLVLRGPAERLLDVHLRGQDIYWVCGPGVGITWNNDTGAPIGTGVDMVRIVPEPATHLVVYGCRFHTQVGGSTAAGDATSVQVIYVHYDDPVVSRSPLVEFVNLDVRTHMTGPSTIGVGANQRGAARVNVQSSFVHAAIAVDVKARGNGDPVPFQILDSVIESEPAYQLPRCWKQQNDAVLTDVRGTVCRFGQLQFSTLEPGSSPHEHTLDGLTLRDAPAARVKGLEMISLGGGQSLRGEIAVEGDPGPLDAKLLNAHEAGEVDLRVRFQDCHPSYRGNGGAALLHTRGTQLGSPRIAATGPSSCEMGPQLATPNALAAVEEQAASGHITREADGVFFVEGALFETGSACGD